MQRSKMLKICLIFSLCFVAARAFGEFSVLSCPKSISFKGTDPLQSQFVGDVLSAAVGSDVADDAQWKGLTVNDPFHLANGVVAVLVEGTNRINVNSNAKTFELQGDNSYTSLNTLNAELEAANVPICDINFKQLDEGLNSFQACFGSVAVTPVAETKYLNPTLHTADKQFLETLGYLNAIIENLSTMEKESNFLIVRLTLENIAKSHGEKSDALTEASKLVSALVAKLNTAAQKSSNNDALVVLIASKSSGNKRGKRAAETDTKVKNPYNLAVYYSQDYPVIFNIILWFMVAFALSLLAICYAIGSMDPGRDSIIYRMTSTRMKKDN